MKATGVISVAIVTAALLFAAGQSRLDAQQAADPAIQIGAADLGGMVTGPVGPEAGVWVIAETTDLPTKFAKIVVTDERGRYLLPGLPKANYHVWVRGYGLVDSPKVRTAPGKILNLTAVPAPSAAAAAEYYPAIYWYSMLRVPERSEFPGTGPDGNGINPALKSQEQWLDIVKTNGCYACHAIGTKAMRTIPKELGDFASSADAWQRRIQSGQALTQMTTNLGRMGNARALKLFGDWTDRIAAGELPAVAAAGRRAQCRAQPVGLGGTEGVPARRGLHRQAQPAPQPQRPDLRRHRGKHRPLPGTRPREPPGDTGEDARPRCRHAVVEAEPDAAVGVLGRRAHLGQPDEHAQPDAR
jgi:hypothetical protein